tara:strand:+ start:125 stop:412 length:288 start_codon:yes stop_codon:yes gene_type:complete
MLSINPNKIKIMSKLYKTDGTIEDFNPANGKEFTLDEMQKAVGGYIELVYLPNNEVLVVDEEGMIKEKLFNKKISEMIMKPIVGNVILCKRSQIN